MRAKGLFFWVGNGKLPSMTRTLLSVAALTALATPAFAQEAADAPPSPNQIVEQAAAEEWVRIAPEDLLVMTLAPDAAGNERTVVIQLMPPPFSQGWVKNIRTLARAGWYDGITVNRVQDNYVVQWGDPNYDNPEATGEAKPLPEGLRVMDEEDYVVLPDQDTIDALEDEVKRRTQITTERLIYANTLDLPLNLEELEKITDAFPGAAVFPHDAYAISGIVYDGWALGGSDIGGRMMWPVHCYGMVGVGRGYSPDTGSGAELYTVIGHAPRHLDRNIALVGRVVEGIEHLSSLPRGKGQLGFYEDAERRTPILSIRVASDLPPSEQPAFEYLSTEGPTFARYAEARANRRDPFFIVPAGGADICNSPVPVRRVDE